MLGISGGDPSFRDDDGSAHPEVVAVLAEFEAGHCGERAVLLTLARSRLLVPVVAVLAEPSAEDTGQPAADVGQPAEDVGQPAEDAGQPAEDAGQPAADGPLRPAINGEKASDMAMPTLIGLDGRRAVPAFTSVGSLKLWQADARPVPATASAVWQAARGESSAVVIDVAGPVPFAVEGARLAALARGEDPPHACDDPDVHEVVADVLAHQLAIASFELETPDEEHDLAIVLALTPEAAAGAGESQLTQLGSDVMQAVMARLGARLRRGVAVYLAAADE